MNGVKITNAKNERKKIRSHVLKVVESAASFINAVCNRCKSIAVI